MDETTSDEPVERRHLRIRGKQAVERGRPVADRFVHARLGRRETSLEPLRQAGADREPAVEAARHRIARMLLKHVENDRAVLGRGERQRHQPARAKQNAGVDRAIFERNFRIAAEAPGAHRHRLDHGAEPADGRAFGIKARQAAIHDRDVGRRAADIRDDGVVEAGQVAGADEAGGRAG